MCFSSVYNRCPRGSYIMKIFQRNLPTRPCTVLLLMVNGSWRQLRRLKREDFFLVGVTEEAHVTRKHCLSFRLAAILGYQFVSCNSIHTEREWYFQRKYGTRTSFKEGTHFTSSQPSQQGGHCKGRAQYMIMKSLLRRMKCLTLQLLYEGVLHSSMVLQCSETSQAWGPTKTCFLHPRKKSMNLGRFSRMPGMRPRMR